ncbi:TadE/TadG family type IV pilus assembly protein, partial [Eubacterium sp.]|uniref:TadE/TadG family type IV pilus assembly protein n=1 Tax=Eubacterium sp. TaxID=142586 RepID=UPI003F0BA2A1
MKKLFKRKENGDIALISIFASIVILTILALIIDFGLIYYQSARLQNAVDSATVAVAHNLMADDASIKNTVETYMKENGVDITEKGYGAITSGTLTTKITYGDEDAIVLIDKKGLLTEEAENADDGRYITAGYLKVTVAVKCKGYWSAFSGLTGKQIVKSGYAKCDMQYNDMPEALKYTIFGNSPNITDDYRKMTVRIDGRTNNTQAVANMFVKIINGINEGFVQPIIGAFGGEPNYNTLLNASLSHAIVNGDVHSNSDISIGVNTIQASRAKDADFNGKEEECICSVKCKENSVNTYCSVCQNDYRKCDGDEQTNDDYNQVIFTAVNKIDFSAGKYANNSFIGSVIGSDNDFETRVYVRNFQYVEQTQVVLYVLDQIDFDTITSTETLRSVFTQTATEYFTNSITLPESQRNAILAQADNLEYISKNKYQLNAQKSIVYAASNAMANDVMLAVQSGNTLVNMLQPVLDSGGIDPTATPETLLRYDGTNLDIENSVVTFTKPDSDQTAELYIVDSENTNRSVIDMTKQSLTTDSATAGYRFAVAKTFQQFANHIDAPNMKPYFIRAINRSVKNATTTKDSDSTATEYEDAKSVKDAVKKSQARLVNTINSKNTMATINNGDGTFSKGSADSTTDPSAVADGQSDTYIDNTYRTSASVTRQETSPLFRYRLNSTTNDKNKLVTNNDNGQSPYTLIKYGNNDAGHTTYNGVKVFNDEGNLSTAQEVVDDYAQKNNSKYGKDAVDKFEQTDVLVDADADDPSVHDYDNHYGDDAVAKKKHYIENTLMLSEDSKFTDAAPKKDDVFLMSSGTKKSYLEQNITNIKNMAGAIGSTALSIPADLRVDPVTSRYRTLIDAAVADLGYTLEESTGLSYTGEASISKDYNKPDGTHVHTDYSYEALLPGKDGDVDITVDDILTKTRNDFNINGQTMNQANIISLVNSKYTEHRQLMSTSGWTTRTNITKGSTGTNPGTVSYTDNGSTANLIDLPDKSIFGLIEQANKTNRIGSVTERYGILVRAGRSVECTGYFDVQNEQNGASKILFGYNYDNSANPGSTYVHIGGYASISRGDLIIGDNTTVIIDGNLEVGGGKSIFIGNNSKLIVGGYISSEGQFVVGENSIVVANGKNSSSMSLSVGHLLNTAKGSYVYLLADVVKTASSEALTFGGELYAGGAIYKNGGSGNFVFNNDSITYVGRDVSPEGAGDINLKENAILVANLPTEWDETKRNNTGVVRATSGYTINMAAGSVLVTLGDSYHRVDASCYNMEPGSLIVTDMVKCGNSSYTAWLSNIIAKKIDTYTLVFKEGAHVFCSDEIWIYGDKTIEINNSVKIVAGKNGDGESVSGNSAFTFSDSYNNATTKEFAIGCTGTIRNFGSGDFVLGANCFLSAQGLSIGSLTVNQGGGFLIPRDSSTNTNITNLTINDGNSTYIGNNLNVSGTITVNSDVSLYKVSSANSIVVNSGNFLVETDCTATNITVKDEMNVANTLNCSGTIENQGKLLVGVAPKGSNPGNIGSF